MMNSMRHGATKLSILSLLVLASGRVAPAAADPANDSRAPDVGEHTKLRAPEGNKVAFYAYAEGVQIWRWTDAGWVFSRPQAVLYAGGEDGELVGTHYAGPTWESNSGSYVVGAVNERATVDPTAIPWLLLRAVDSDGPGIFDGVTYIQRVNTTGGLAPTYSGNFVGEEVGVPYTADYYFYRAHH